MIRFEEVGLSHKRGQPSALESVTFEIARGAFAVVTGPMGCGKSSVLSLVHRGASPSAGRVLVDEVDVGRLPRRKVAALRSRVQWLGSPPRLLPDRTIFDNVALGLELSRCERPRIEGRTRAALEEVGLLHRGRLLASTASLEVRMRCALARALALAPEVLLLDEPTCGLDADHAEMIVTLIRRAHLRGITVVVATHTPAPFAVYGPQVIHLEDGEVSSVSCPPSCVPVGLAA